MLIKTYGSAVYGISAQLITVEVDVGQGAKTQIIGLPDNAVKESQPRVNAAMKNCGYTYPRKGVVINMAPADIRKEGSSYDLTIAIGVMAAGELIAADLLEESIIMGELSLDGSILPIKGALPIAIQAQKDGYKRLIVPKENAREAAIVKDLEVYGMDNLKDVVELLEGTKEFERTIVNPRDEFANSIDKLIYDFSDVKGQENIKRAMEIAAAGGHNIILIGPPGAGKTMLAKRLNTILPPMNLHEALETTKIHSVAGRLGGNATLMAQRPFRSPHHTISDVSVLM